MGTLNVKASLLTRAKFHVEMLKQKIVPDIFGEQKKAGY